jgi:RNA polymerase sigma-70 factor (ECF subfamily)
VDGDERTDGEDPAEEAWIEAAKHDPRAFAPLYERHAPAIYRFCYRKVGDTDQANDLTAQVFVKAIERIDRYSPRKNATFRSWLFTIARNTITDGWRRHRPTTDIEPIAGVLIDSDHGPEHLAIEREGTLAVNQLLKKLPKTQRAVVELRLAGLSTREIQSTLSMSESAVKSSQHRAYRRLRELVSLAEGAAS